MRRPGRCAGIWRRDDELVVAVVNRGLSVLEAFSVPVLRRPGGLEDALAEVGRKVGRAPAVVAPWAGEAAVRCVRGPKVASREAASAAAWEMQALLSGRPQAYVVRHAVLGAGENFTDILAAAVPEDAVRAAVQPARGRLQLLAVDAEPCALWRAARLAGAVPAEEGPVAIACTGGLGTSVVVGRRAPEFVRVLPPAEGTQEIRRTLSYYESQMDARIARRYWAGPEVPEGFVPLDLGPGGARYAVAAGLAAWPYLEPRMSFLTSEMREDARARSVLPWVLCGVVFACALGLGEIALTFRGEAARLAREAEALRPLAVRAAAAERQAREVLGWEDVVRGFLAGLPARSWVADAVRQSVPPGAWLTKVELLPVRGESQPEKGPALPSPGLVLGVEGRSETVAAAGILRDALSRQPGVESVRVSRVVREDESGLYAFRLEARLAPQGWEVGGK